MQFYDLIFLAILLVCCFTGFMNGAIRSLVNFLSLVLGLIIALYSRGFMASAFHLDSLTSWIAAVVVFALVYLGLRYLGNALSDKVHKEKTYGNIDRIAGLGIGIVSTLVFIGAFHLLFSLVTPIERQGAWFREAKVYPLGAKCAKIIQAFIPKGAGAANRMAKDNDDK
ncbi:MAG TPA: CvpA family protein [Asticcacaulis sp.]|nr:CvpA family protein [Asticcacaulis sp.]